MISRGLGYNYRTTEIQSALGLVQLKKLDRNNRKRKKLAEIYRNELQGSEGDLHPFFSGLRVFLPTIFSRSW